MILRSTRGGPSPRQRLRLRAVSDCPQVCEFHRFGKLQLLTATLTHAFARGTIRGRDYPMVGTARKNVMSLSRFSADGATPRYIQSWAVLSGTPSCRAGPRTVNSFSLSQDFKSIIVDIVPSRVCRRRLFIGCGNCPTLHLWPFNSGNIGGWSA